MNRHTIGAEIRTIRESLGLNQTDFAKLLNRRAPGLGASQPQVSSWELDQTRPHAALVALIKIIAKEHGK